MQTTSFSLGELLRRAKDGSLTIPQFQRQFIWREAQVQLLIDSMSRSYPIGSLLLLDRTPDLPLASRKIEVEIQKGHAPDDSLLEDPSDAQPYNREAHSYILDGQQRTTSIARVFLNSHPEKLYYFDLKDLYKRHRGGETSWIKVRRRGKTEPDRKERNKLLRADIILDQKKSDIYVSEYIEDSGDFPEFAENRGKAREAAAIIKGIFETIRNYKIPVVTLERGSGVESVCRVFETINSTGTRLTTFDLAVARFYPKPDLRSLWTEALENYPILKDYEVDGERVLQVLCLASAGRDRKYREATRSNILALTGERITQEWVKSSEALAETYEWARAQGARPETLPSHNVLVAMAAVRKLFQDSASEEIWKDPDFIRRWYFSKIMQAGASQASNYNIAQDFNALRQYVEGGRQPNVQEVVLDAATLLKLKPSDVRYKALQNLFAMTIRQDLVEGYRIDSESVLHSHHIFPSNAGKKHGLPRDMLDGICNRIPILEKSNERLGEGYPKEYFGDIAAQARKHGTLGGLKRRLSDSMIPGDPSEESWSESFSISNFREFCEQRAKLIIVRVREIVGESLRSSSFSKDEDELAEYSEF